MPVLAAIGAYPRPRPRPTSTRVRAPRYFGRQLRWTPGSINPVAAIKIVRHNLYRPTSLFHETGHQAAHLTGRIGSVRRSINATFAGDPRPQRMWTRWVSEIAADVFAFLHAGFASV